MNRPNYEALDSAGFPYIRQAQTIEELPTTQERQAALRNATPNIAKLLNIQQTAEIKYGSPVFCAFENMTRNKSKQHDQAKLLLSKGCDIPLDYCPEYSNQKTI